MERDIVHIPEIILEWSPWFSWIDLITDARGNSGVRVPNKTPGVYEARLAGSIERLTIGKAKDLRHRIKQGLVKGKSKHSAGIDIRGNENTAQIEVRWAITDRPSAAEEELHRRYREQFGCLPKYTDHT